MFNRSTITSALLFLVSTGCMVGEVGDVSSPSAAPQLTAKPVASGGIHLTWSDNSQDGIHFMVMRGEHAHDAHTGGGVSHDVEHEELAELPAATRQYHDASTEQGSSYVYMVALMTAAGETESNEVTVVAP